MAIAALAGLLVTRRLAKKGWRFKSLLLTFSGVFLFVALTLWHAPEARVRATASELVQSEVTFSIGHPGPPVTRSQHCEAGLRFYDAWLQRPVELCTRDDIVPPGAHTVQLEKRVTAGGQYLPTIALFLLPASHRDGGPSHHHHGPDSSSSSALLVEEER